MPDKSSQEKRFLREIIAIIGALAVGGGGGAFTASAQVENEMKDMDNRIDRIESNQRILDYQGRQTAQAVEWSGDKLDRLLDKENIDKPPKPALPKSELATE